MAERSESDEYSPEQIHFWLSGRCPRCRWSMLESAVEGGTGCSGMGSGRGERFGLAHLKADLEHAADQLPLHWQSTALIFAKQHRTRALTQKRQAHPFAEADLGVIEDPRPSVALDNALYAMAKLLGWSPVAQSAA